MAVKHDGESAQKTLNRFLTKCWNIQRVKMQQQASNGIIYTTRRRIRFVEVWFDDMPPSLKECDILICHQRKKPFSEKRWLYFYTIRVDINIAPEILLGRMRKSTITQIRQARDRDGINCTFYLMPTLKEINEFSDFIDANPPIPGQDIVDRSNLEMLNQAEILGLSKAQTSDGKDLVWHCLICHRRQGCARLMYSASLHHNNLDKSLKNLNGRANRFLYYSEMLFLKERDFGVYDFGGWYAGSTDKKRLQINNFKEGFGGKIVCGYDCEEPFSLKGKAYLFLRNGLKRLTDPGAFNEMKRRRQKVPLEPRSDAK